MSDGSNTVLVTGAAGFIGSHLAEAVARQRIPVRAFVRYTSRRDIGLLRFIDPDLQSKVEIIFGDLGDPQAVRHAVSGVEIVFHLAASISIPYSYVHPREVAETNVMGTLNVLQACHEMGAKRMVHTSSSEVYGTALYAPIDEAHPLQGQSPYSASKIGADKLVESFHCAYELPVVTLRPFNTYGPRQSDRAVIPTIITQALTADVIRLGNLHSRRDLTYVTDTVNGFLKVAKAEGVEGKTYNLGVGEDITIGDLARKVVEIVGRDVRIEVEPQRLRPEGSEVQRLISDYSLAQRELGWKPEVSLDDGLSRTIEWISKNLDLYLPGKYRF